MPKSDKSSAELNPADPSGRRTFLMNALKISGQLALANTAIYTVSLIGPGGKYGGMTAAGTKCYPPDVAIGMPPSNYCCYPVVWDSLFGWVCN